MTDSTMSRRDLLKTGGALLAGAAMGGSGPAFAEKSKGPMKEYDQYDAVGLAELVARGDVSAEELLDTAIARCEAVNPTLNAVVIKLYEHARKAIRQGLPDGPLHGVPFLLKDLGIALAGTVTDDGSKLLAGHVENYNSTLTKRYQAAGLVIFGKTHSPELANSPSSESALYGKTHNPWNLDHSAGGSSGGTAAAVAGGIVPAGHGSDGGGSIRIPSSACGLFGMKVTRGRVPLGPPHYEERNGLSVAHALTRSVRDSALLLDISQGPDIGDPYPAPRRERPYFSEVGRDPGTLRIALLTESLQPVPVHPDCVKAAEQAATLCESLGHHVEHAKPEIDPADVVMAQGISGVVMAAEIVGAAEARLGRKARPDELEKITWEMVESGRKASALDMLGARRAIHRTGVALAKFHQHYDIILSPTLAIGPPNLGVLDLGGDMREFARVSNQMTAFTALYNVTGQPAMSVPLPFANADGLPIGAMFAARFGDEGTLYRLAGQLERARPWFHRLPQVG